MTGARALAAAVETQVEALVMDVLRWDETTNAYIETGSTESPATEVCLDRWFYKDDCILGGRRPYKIEGTFTMRFNKPVEWDVPFHTWAASPITLVVEEPEAAGPPLRPNSQVWSLRVGPVDQAFLEKVSPQGGSNIRVSFEATTP